MAFNEYSITAPSTLPLAQPYPTAGFINIAWVTTAKPDGTTDWASALADAVTYLGNAGVIRFPFVQGTANSYYFATFDPSTFNGITFDIDYGVFFNIPGEPLINGSDTGIKYERESLFYFRDFNDYYLVLPQGNDYIWTGGNGYKWSKSLYVDPSEVEKITTAVLNPAAGAFAAMKVAYPTGDTFSADTFAATSPIGYILTPGSADGNFHVGLTSVVPGQSLSCAFSGVVGNPFIAGMVRTLNGYYIIYCSVDDAMTSLAKAVKIVSTPVVNTDLSFLGKGTHQSYSGYFTDWEIVIENTNQFSVYFGGYAVGGSTTTAPIISAGFGLYPQTASDSIVVDYPVAAYGKNMSAGGNLLNAAVFGDSISAPARGCWPNYARDCLDGSDGIRLYNIDNYAVGGNTAAQQYTIMQTVPIQNYNVVYIMVGTNDIQGGTNLATYLSTVQDMITYCVNNGATPIIGIPPMFYTQGQSGRGQASVNYASGSTYRTGLKSLAYQNGLQVVETTKFLGPVLANYIDTVIVGNPLLAGDPVVVDNIHPSELTRIKLGKAFAAATVAEFRKYSSYATLARPETLSNKFLSFTAFTGYSVSGSGNTPALPPAAVAGEGAVATILDSSTAAPTDSGSDPTGGGTYTRLVYVANGAWKLV